MSTTTCSAAAALAPVVDALVREPVAELCVAELQELLTVVVPQLQRLEGLGSLVSGELQGRTGGTLGTDDGGSRTVASWLAEQQRQSPPVVGSALKTSTALRSLPVVAAAVLDGVLTQAQAAVLARLVGRIPDAALAEAEPDLVLVASTRNPSELSAYVQHLLATHCEPELDADADRGRARRFLQTSRESDGSLRGRFLLPPEQAEVFLTATSALSRRQGLADDRTAAQRRADALAEVHEQVLRHGDLPDHGGRRPQISYVLPADWAARQSQRQSCPSCVTCPSHRPASFADTVAAGLPGMPGTPAEQACAVGAWTGPGTRAHLETLLCDARITRVLLCERGQVTGLQPLRDTVTTAQRRALAGRDLGCAARGCTRPPAMCDAHHLVRRADGGSNDLDNLVLLCRRHHVLWHLGRITLADLHVPWHPEARSTGPPRAAPQPS